ncbi:3-ketosphinganine reductase-like protein [Periconia macrospinosa]|uniref:3-dehydrosphinganine reductase n=1 Tax=Periconia macrospinosa TaxID=97972 RepID=A0A2V1EFR6_9PLEO|nr:3-ketosphinganine reductase-like protein [Periconia macrospinosa]
MGFFSRSDQFQVEGLTVLLTGASQGMGLEVAKILAQRGAHVVLVARNSEKLQTAKDQVQALAKNPASQRFHAISADVAIESENVRLLHEATVWNHGRTPEIVWANAGSSTPGLFLDTSMATLRSQMDVNYWAAAYLAHHTLRAWLYPDSPYKADDSKANPQPPRHLIFTSSVLSCINVAGYCGYSAAKSAMKSLSDGLRMEANVYNGARRATNHPNGQQPAPFDVQVQCIFPATITSPGHANEQLTKPGVTKKIEEGDDEQSSYEAAIGAIKGLDAGKYSTSTTFKGHLMRTSGMGAAPRDSVIFDTLAQLIASIIWLFLSPSWESTVWNWGKTHGMEKHKPNSI